jgi:predicted enzyme related to lactoylglutathione lyase
MPGPARAGAVIYAKDLERLSHFYRQLLQMRLLHAGDGYHVIESADMQLVVHAIPAHIASTIEIASPPAPREETAIKLFFTVESFASAHDIARQSGGEVFTEEWAGSGFKARNGLDPEGNVFQVREAVP